MYPLFSLFSGRTGRTGRIGEKRRIASRSGLTASHRSGSVFILIRQVPRIPREPTRATRISTAISLMLSLHAIYTTLLETDGLIHSTTLKTILDFIRAASALRYAIIHDQPPSFDAEHVPGALPNRVCFFLSQWLDLRPWEVDGLWDALSVVVWTQASELLGGTAARWEDEICRQFKLSMSLSLCAIIMVDL